MATTDHRRMGVAGNLGFGDVISNYLVEDLQAVLEALIWTTGSSGDDFMYWDYNWPLGGAYGQGFDADMDTALNLAIAAYTTGVGCPFGPSTPMGAMDWDGNLRGRAGKKRAKGIHDYIREDGYVKDIYFFAAVIRSGDEWSDQGEGVTENTMHLFETMADVTNGNNGANSFKTTGYFGGIDWANSPTDKPSGVNGRGWCCGDSPVVIDWRDGFDYY